MIKLLYELETKPIIPATKSTKSVIESKGGYIMILLTILLFSDSTLRGNLHFESKVNKVLLLLQHTLMSHQFCERYQIYKEYDISRENFQLMEMNRLFQLLEQPTLRLSISSKLSDLFVIKFIFRCDNVKNGDL